MTKRIGNTTTFISLTAVLGLLAGEASAGRFGGGFHGGGGGFHEGGFGGGFSGGARMALPQPRSFSPAGFSRPGGFSPSTINGPYGAFNRGAAGVRPGAGGAGERHVWTGPHGGTIYGGGGQHSYTGPGGNTYAGGGGRWAYTGPHGTVAFGGGNAGSISGAGGRSISGGQTGHVIIGPNGNVNAGGSRGAAAKGPNGEAIASGHAGATVDPYGATANANRWGIASGPSGTAAAGSRAGIAVGPYGAVAGGNRFVAGRGAAGGVYAASTHFVAASNLHGQGALVRNGFRYTNAFTPGWYARYPGAWFAAGWLTSSIWTAATWGACSGYLGYAADTTPVSYDYGDNVSYADGNVYYGDQVYSTQDQYAQQASDIAAAGATARPAADEKWQPLGVFAMVKGDETTSDDVFQLAIDQAGVIRGNYYNAVSDSTQPVQGSLDNRTQRVAWTIGENKSTVFEAGLYNLTQGDANILAHYGKDRTEQFKLFRIEQSQNKAATSTK